MKKALNSILTALLLPPIMFSGCITWKWRLDNKAEHLENPDVETAQATPIPLGRKREIENSIAGQLKNMDNEVVEKGANWRNIIVLTMAPTLKNLSNMDERKYAHDLYQSHLESKKDADIMSIFQEYCTILVARPIPATPQNEPTITLPVAEKSPDTTDVTPNVNDLSQRVTDLSRQVTALAQDVAILQTSKTQSVPKDNEDNPAAQELQLVKTRLHAVEAELKTNQAELKRREVQLQNTEAELNLKENKLKNATEELSLKSQENKILFEERQKAAVQYDKSLAEHKALVEKFANLEQEYNVLKNRISSLDDTILKLRNEKAALQAALEKNGVTPFTAPMSSKNNDSGKLLEEHQELLNKYGTMNDNYRNLQKDYKNLEKQYGSINKQNQELINDYQVLNRKYQELNSKYQELINKKSVALPTPQPPQQQQTVTVVQPPASLSAARMLQIKTRIAKQLENFDRQVEIDGMGWRNVIIMTMAPTLKNMRDMDERKYAHDLYLSHLQGKPNFSSMYIFSEYCTKLIKE
jgi:septal ring factor EnvC (AmiA/AmiB activator)